MFRWLMIAIVFYFVWWWIGFWSNPYTFCKDHPDKELTQIYYLCEPFGFNYPIFSFELAKGKYEAKDQVGTFIQPNNRYQDPNDIQDRNKRAKCSDPLFRRSNAGKELCN